VEARKLPNNAKLAPKIGILAIRRGEIREPEINVDTPEPEVEVEENVLDDEPRIVIVGAGGYGRLALDVLVSAGFEPWIMGFYDDAHRALSERVRGFPILGDIGMLKSMLSVETVQVIVAITSNQDRLRVANSIRGLGGQFTTAVHPMAYVSDEASVGDGSVVAAGAVIHPGAVLGSHCYSGPQTVVDRDAEVGAGVWISAGAVVGSGARVGARVVLGQNSCVGRKAAVGGDKEVGALQAVASGSKA
jgi:sugar O-acyltransferase (sialic acid O-acetyltransferase NeuD family)